MGVLLETDPTFLYSILRNDFGFTQIGSVLTFSAELRVLLRAASQKSPLHAEHKRERREHEEKEGRAERAAGDSGSDRMPSKEGLDWAVSRLKELLDGESTEASEEATVRPSSVVERSSDTRTRTGRIGLLEVETQYFPFSDGPYVLGPQSGPLQLRSGVLGRCEAWPSMERWSLLTKLAKERGNGSVQSSELGELASFIEVNSTDTHVVVWRDITHKRIVVSFRGTDINWKDVLTDLMCFQTDVSWLFDPQPTSSAGPQLDDGPKPPAAGPDPSGLGNFAYEGSESPPPKAHIGFCIAYASCREQLTRTLRALLPKDEEELKEWTVCSTGHSLGGSLSTLFAVDVAVRIPQLQVIMYNFGAPKVGDDEFVRRYNELVPNSFRIVNDADVIVRLPRNKGVGSIPGATNYYHIGRTVLLSPDTPVWVEGESPGDDPLSERWESLSDLLEAEVNLMQTLVEGRGFVQHVENGYYEAMLSMLQRTRPTNMTRTESERSGRGATALQEK